MMMPSILTNELFNDWMDFPWENEFFTSKNPLYGKHEKNIILIIITNSKKLVPHLG